MGAGGPRGADFAICIPVMTAAYQAGQPADDARFITVFARSLEHTDGYTPEEARRAAGILLPDILSTPSTRPRPRSMDEHLPTTLWMFFFPFFLMER